MHPFLCTGSQTFCPLGTQTDRRCGDNPISNLRVPIPPSSRSASRTKLAADKQSFESESLIRIRILWQTIDWADKRSDEQQLLSNPTRDGFPQGSRLGLQRPSGGGGTFRDVLHISFAIEKTRHFRLDYSTFSDRIIGF